MLRPKQRKEVIVKPITFIRLLIKSRHEPLVGNPRKYKNIHG